MPFSSVFCSVVVIRFPVVFPCFPIILRYGFLCSCPACSVENDVTDVVSTSDARRVEVARLQENLPAADPAEGVEMAQRVLQLLDEEGRGFFWQDGRTILTQKKSLEYTLSRTISLHFTSTCFSSVFNAERHFRLDAARPSLHRGIHSARTMDL